ncbi:MAG: hypothetical protein ACTHKH_21345 [Trinickia sp.]
MNASHRLPGAPARRPNDALRARRAPLEPASARRFAIAIACLGVSYALSWIELPLGHIAPVPADGASPVSSPLAAALTARALIGLLYALVALRFAWARWLTVVLCLASAVFVAPWLPLEWRVFPLGALVTGFGLAMKLVAGALLALPLRARAGH